jgi:hypothetical protein
MRGGPSPSVWAGGGGYTCLLRRVCPSCPSGRKLAVNAAPHWTRSVSIVSSRGAQARRGGPSGGPAGCPATALASSTAAPRAGPGRPRRRGGGGARLGPALDVDLENVAGRPVVWSGAREPGPPECPVSRATCAKKHTSSPGGACAGMALGARPWQAGAGRPPASGGRSAWAPGAAPHLDGCLLRLSPAVIRCPARAPRRALAGWPRT